MNKDDEIHSLEVAIRDLDLDYMRGLIPDDEYNKRMSELRGKLAAAGGTPKDMSSSPPVQPRIVVSDLQSARLRPPEKKAMVDPVTAVKKTIEDMRRIPIERIAQEAGVPTHMVSRILIDLLDGRELSGRVDHDSGDFMLGSGTGPAPKTVAVCPYCKQDLKRIAVKGETITCSMCKESFVVV